jgi:acetyl esterase/lipase
MIGINLEYRLAPKFPWPAGAEDIGAVLRWIEAEIGSHGGNPDRVFLMGHSAGATHAASYVSHPEFHGPKGSGLAGAIFSSGAYDHTTRKMGEPQMAYFGSDPSLYGTRSALPGLLKSSIPFMMSTAELDPPDLAAQFHELKAAMCASPRGCARAVLLPQHSHMSESYSINTPDTQLTSQILEFMKTGH